MSYRVLCVDPDETARDETVEELQAELSDLDARFETAGSLADATGLLTVDTDAVITEYTLPDGTGFDLIGAARETAPDAGCILYTDTDPDTIDTTELRGAITEYVGKGSVFGAERLARLLRSTVETRAQSSYPLPQDEDERLAALQVYDLDDDDLLTSLDRITDLAATHFGAETASINIINEHSQEFLACYGSANDWEPTDREDSICTFTILEEEGVMTVEDVTEDPRFETRSDSLLGMGIRSYIGANLVTPAGLVIGALCVYDEQARSFSPDEQSYLRNLATVAMDLIELHSQLDTTVGGSDR